MPNNLNIDFLVSKVIKKFSNLFLTHPNIILTEEDARCYLYYLLLQHIPELAIIKTTQDRSTSIALHTEIRWYGIDKQLKKRSDIVIIDPFSLWTKSQGKIKIHTKGFSFNDYYAIMEIKMRRINGSSDNKYASYIADDIKKLRKLVAEGAKFNNIKNPNYYLICLDKKRSIKNLIQKKIQITEPNIKLFYFYKNVR